jgi:hypothetical protein
MSAMWRKRGIGILDFGFWILDFGFWILGTTSSQRNFVSQNSTKILNNCLNFNAHSKSPIQNLKSKIQKSCCWHSISDRITHDSSPKVNAETRLDEPDFAVDFCPQKYSVRIGHNICHWRSPPSIGESSNRQLPKINTYKSIPPQINISPHQQADGGADLRSVKSPENQENLSKLYTFAGDRG